MAQVDPAKIRNVAVVGHRGSGKTSLVEAILYTAGAKNRLGSVVDGTTTLDHDEDEIKRQMSISAAMAHVEWDKRKINLVDTPGEASFINEAMATLTVVEGALIVVNAVAKVEVQTERLWRRALDLGVARLVAVNMMDRERADFEEVLTALADRFGDGVVPVALPIGKEQSFSGLVDLVHMKAYTYADSSGKAKEIPIPAELLEAATTARELLVERVAESADSLIEKFLEGEELTLEEILEALKAGAIEGRLSPVIPVSATKNIGIDRLLDMVEFGLPSPARVGARRVPLADGSGDVEVSPDPNGPAALFVFKTISDQFSGRINLAKVLSGHIASDSHLVNPRTGDKERTGNILTMQGKESKGIEEASAGDIIALGKLKDTSTGDTLADASLAVRLPSFEFPPPAISFAITAKTKGEEEKVANALKRLGDEDPAMQFRFDAQTHEMIIAGTSQMHVEVLLDKMKRRFGAEVDLHPPSVPYRETIRKTSTAQGRHKKQTGGRGQFGDCWIEIQPLPRGGGFEFEDAIVGGSIPRGFIPAVEKGVIETMDRGVIAGYSVVDVKVKLFDGSYHTVDSSEMAFKIAGSLAFAKAMEGAAPVLLEPVMNVEVIVPEANMGDIMGDLSSRRGRPQGSESMGEMHAIRAQVPLAEMLTYAPQLRSMTGGRGSYTMELDHYDEVPAHLTEKIVEDAKAARGE
ncbi:MAG TPA: elongation factor G [Thermoleophilia bacterium]|nr:elongation factor G [Thermoleophilia bacterium]